MVTTDRKSKRPDTASQAGCTSDAVVAPDADATAEPAHTSFFEDFIEGWRWTLRRHTLLAICVIAALVNFGLNGVFAAVNLQLVSTHVDSVRLGFVNTVMGVGMLIGAPISMPTPMTVLTKPSRTESTWVLTSCRFTAANTPLSPKFTSAAITQIASSVCLRSVQRHPSMKSSKNEVCAGSAVASASGATTASDVQPACDAVSGRLLLRSVVTMPRTCSFF